MIHIRIDPSSGLPIYLQIIEEMKLLLAAGALRPGQQLPSVRNLSVELRINPNTVARAYTEMEREGFIHTRRGEGTFVSEQKSSLQEKSQLEILSQKADDLIRTALRFRIPRERLLKILAGRFARIEERKEV